MIPQRVQMGRHGPQFSFTKHKGTVYVLDHDIGRSVTNAADEVCAFVWDTLQDLPANSLVVYRDTERAWDIMLVHGGRFAGFRPGHNVLDLTEAEAAFGLGGEGHESPVSHCA